LPLRRGSFALASVATDCVCVSGRIVKKTRNVNVSSPDKR